MSRPRVDEEDGALYIQSRPIALLSQVALMNPSRLRIFGVSSKPQVQSNVSFWSTVRKA